MSAQVQIGSTLGFPRERARRCVRPRAQEMRMRHEKPVLTARQVEYLERLIAGETAREIALDTGCALQNVHEVLRAACARTGNRTRLQLVAWYAVRRGELKGEAA